MLDAEGLEAVERLERELLSTWATDDPVGAFGDAIRGAIPAAETVFFPGAVGGPPRWTVSSLLPRQRGELPVKNKMPRYRAYGDRKTDPFANRPVACHDLGLAFGRECVESIVEELLAPIGLHHQLRSVMYDREGRVALYAGYFRKRDAPPFAAADHARLHAIQAPLRRWTRLAEAIGLEPMGDGKLAESVARLDVPALLVSRGRIVFANRHAREGAAPDRGFVEGFRAAGTTIPVRTHGPLVDLVLLPRLAPAPGSWASCAARLPPYLRPAAELLRQGLGDKEIALALGAPLATVRTYSQRILRAAGVDSRRALMRLP
jgi:hypothetical protein